MQSILSNTKSKQSPLFKNTTLQYLKRPKLSTHTSFKASNLYLILISCIIFGFHFCSAQEIKSNKEIKNHHFNLIYDSNAQRYECLIGFQINTQQKDPNSLFVSNTLKELVPNTLKEQNAKEWINNKFHSKWKYCVIKQDIEGQSSRIIFYSSDWEQCRVKCCATVSKDQCYFKASSQQQSIVKFNNPKIYLRTLQTQTLNNNQKDQPKDSANVVYNNKEQIKQELASISSQNNNPNGDQNSSGGAQIVMIVLLCIFGVPFTLLLFFAILSIVKLCRGESRPIIQAVNNPNPTESIIIEQINLDEYKMDEMGPYHINSLEQCSICLNQNVNIRTQCGHYYHPECIKAWMMRGKNRCPVCNCTKLNPMKVYCKKCSVGIKLVLLHGLVDDQFVTQITNLICEGCLQDKKSAFSPTPSPRKQQNSRNNQSPRKQQSIRKNQSPRKQQTPSKQQTPRRRRRRESRVISLRSESVGEEHNQNQIQSLAIRQSTDQLRQNVG